jgi:uncharacterized membrane protein
MKQTVADTAGISALWTAYWATHGLETTLQLLLLLISIIGGILYIAVMWKKLRSPEEPT